MKRVLFYAAAVFILCGAIALAGCGYTFLGSKGLKVASIRIGEIKNESTEPGLSEMLVSALSDELMKQGISVDRSSPNVLDGSIQKFELTGVSEADQSFTAYQISISGRFVYRDATGKEFVLLGSSPFIISFSSQGALNQVFAQRQLAVQAGMQDLSSQIVSGLLIQYR